MTLYTTNNLDCMAKDKCHGIPCKEGVEYRGGLLYIFVFILESIHFIALKNVLYTYSR